MCTYYTIFLGVGSLFGIFDTKDTSFMVCSVTYCSKTCIAIAFDCYYEFLPSKDVDICYARSMVRLSTWFNVVP